jgi:CRISPR-associated endonuclease/helicase Cas3
LTDQEQVLCVVNLKRHAVGLADLLRQRCREGLLHLSTNMCALHRTRVLQEVRDRLDSGLTCRLISTQCIEAGVDLDFPTVYRAFGPLEAVAQAAGRCNRNGRFPGKGTVTVFRPLLEENEGEYPDPYYGQASSVTEEMLARSEGTGIDIDDPESYRKYYTRLYDLTGAHLSSRRAKVLREAILALDFVETAKAYRIIAQDAVNVIVPYDTDRWTSLAREARRLPVPTSEWVHLARLHSISLFRPQPGAKNYAEKVAYLDPLFTDDISSAEWCSYLSESGYDSLYGFREERQSWIA